MIEYTNVDLIKYQNQIAFSISFSELNNSFSNFLN